LDLFEARERRRQQRKQQQEEQQQKEQQQGKQQTSGGTTRKSLKKKEYEPGTGVQQGRPLTESLQDELRRVNAEIALLKTKKRRK